RVTALLRVGAATVEARADAADPPAVGAEVAVAVDARQLVVFAAERSGAVPAA
ncbi:MAG: hypothetical protein AVDCRST_MAG11-685, partial [uncultured Gemmatimonadaceae bacterium]